MSKNNTIQALGGDKFLINGDVLTLQQLIMKLELERANNLENQLAAELNNMAKLNNLLAEANDFLQEARATAPVEGQGARPMPPEMLQFFDKHGIEYVGNGLTMGWRGWQVSIENLKSFIDGLNSRSQLEMINISSLMKKRDESLTMPSNTNNSIHQTNQGILSKI